MIRFFSFICVCAAVLFTYPLSAQDVKKLNDANQSVTYEQAIQKYQQLDRLHSEAQLTEAGSTDIGRPLHLFAISKDGTFTAAEARRKGKLVLLINNAIHPGEPDGVDASIRFSEQLMAAKDQLPQNVVILIVPVFNIDGSLKRGCCSRANQNGPEAYGFRGNARNLDLNRDFIKCDSENTKSLIGIFAEWDPDVFLDTHVSDGSDYQYTMTLISTQHNKLGGPAGSYLKNKMTPSLFEEMKKAGEEMAPYVNTARYDDSPEKGIYGFLEQPRFASGYAALFHCLAFVAETHMLKPFNKRVGATIKLMNVMLNFCNSRHEEIIKVRNESRNYYTTATQLPLSWEPDTSKKETILFKGYEAYQATSKVTGASQLYFDETKPYVRPVNFYDHYTPGRLVEVPDYYLLPQAWKEVAEHLKVNRVKMTRLEKDTVFEVQQYVIKDVKSPGEPYEGHFLHTNVTTETRTSKVVYYKGDYLIPVRQNAVRYIVETCEPTAPDSWFAWGFFDSILQQKEWFSSYVFDGMAEEILKNNPVLLETLNQKRAFDKDFASNSFAQLYFIYRNSQYYEDYRVFPISRLSVVK